MSKEGGGRLVVCGLSKIIVKVELGVRFPSPALDMA